MSVTTLLVGDPEQVGVYRLIGRLGAGGMGVVYLAEAPDGQRVALKLIRPEYAGDHAFRSRFRREVEAVRRVHGRCIARHLDAEVEGLRPFLVTEYVEGPSLSEVVAQTGPLPEHQVTGLAVGLLEALIAIHAAGIVHRDLKPANVLLATDAPRVIDFGIAHAADATPMTQLGNVVGSAGWMAPEQATGHPISSAADVFAWASVVTFAATGRPPFGEGRPEAVMYRVVHHRPDLRALPAALGPLLDRAFDKSPTARPSPVDLLQSLTDGGPVQGSAGAVTRVLDDLWAPPPALTAGRGVLTAGRPVSSPQRPPDSAPARSSPEPATDAAPGPRTGQASPDRPWMGIAVASMTLLLAIVVAGVAWAMNRDEPGAGPSSTVRRPGSASSAAPTTPVPPSLTSSPSPTAVPTVDPADAWTTRQASAGPNTVFSEVSRDGVVPAALSATGRVLTVWSFRGERWVEDTPITLPAPVDTGTSIERADVTDDGNDDFVVPMSDSSVGSVGSVVSQHGGSWRLVPFREGTGGDVRAVADLQASGGQLSSTANDCLPTCVLGTTTDTTWAYDTSADVFTAESSSDG